MTTAVGRSGITRWAPLAAGIGVVRELGFGGLVVATLISLIGWFVWALVAYFVGTRLLPGPRTRADIGQLLRTIGFSATPGLIRVLGIVPGLDWLLSLVAALWILAAMVVAVRQALDYDTTGRAVAVCAIGFVINVVVLSVLAKIMGVSVGVAGR